MQLHWPTLSVRLHLNPAILWFLCCRMSWGMGGTSLVLAVLKDQGILGDNNGSNIENRLWSNLVAIGPWPTNSLPLS